MDADTIIQNGRVIDPANGIDGMCDVAIKDGRLAAVGPGLLLRDAIAGTYFDASGCIVCPGLVDSHVHAYEHCTPLGINIDRFCLKRGVTSVVDAGSAGATTFAGLRKFIAEASTTRLFAYLHIAAHGMSAAGCAGFGAGGECDSLNQVDPDLCLQCIHDNKDMIIGVKVRLTADVCAEGKNEHEAYRRALDVGERAAVPIMTHHTFSSIEFSAKSDKLGCPGSMRAGDVYTHTFHGYPSSILHPHTRRVHRSVLDARQRGVLFDLGHGQGSFSWTVAELCSAQGFYPDLISTDLHSGNMDGPAYDLPTTMSKMRHVGMPLYDVVRATTSAAANAIKRSDSIGSLGIGRRADVTVLHESDIQTDLEDSQGQIRRITKILRPVVVWKDGISFSINTPATFPNVDKWEGLRKPWDQLLIKDAERPSKTFLT